jgi:hypothetical protein
MRHVLWLTAVALLATNTYSEHWAGNGKSGEPLTVDQPDTIQGLAISRPAAASFSALEIGFGSADVNQDGLPGSRGYAAAEAP